jgi:hypothetical protein
MAEKDLDLTLEWRKDGTYTVPGSCANCGWEGRLTLSRGSEAPSHFPGYKAARCGRCGCKSVGRQK